MLLMPLSGCNAFAQGLFHPLWLELPDQNGRLLHQRCPLVDHDPQRHSSDRTNQGRRDGILA